MKYASWAANQINRAYQVRVELNQGKASAVYHCLWVCQGRECFRRSEKAVLYFLGLLMHTSEHVVLGALVFKNTLKEMFYFKDVV